MANTFGMSKKRAAVSREPLATQVAHLIKSAIMDGEYALGERLVEAELAQKCGISRHVVREALQVLEGEGLVVSDPFCGRSVVNPSPKEIEGLYLLRISMESMAAALAAYKITPQQKHELIKLGTQIHHEPKDFLELMEMDFGIHRAIWQIADEPVVTRNLEKLLWPLMRAIPLLEVSPEEKRSATLEAQLEKERSNDPGGHGPLLKAICSQNSAAAREQMIVHLVCSGNYSKETTAALQASFGIP